MHPCIHAPMHMHPCIHNMRAFLSCVAAVRDAAPEGFAAVKVTGPTYCSLLTIYYYYYYYCCCCLLLVTAYWL